MPIPKLESEIAGLIHPSAVLQGGLVARIPCLLALHLRPHRSTITLAAAAADLSKALPADFALWRGNCFPHLYPFLWRRTAKPTNSLCTSTSHVAALLSDRDYCCSSLVLSPLLSPSWLLHFFHRDPLGIYRQDNVTFHTGSLCALPCRLGWIKTLSNASWLDISPTQLPLPFTLAKPRIPLSLPLSFSTPPAFSKNPKRRILPRESAPWNHRRRPRYGSAEEEREKASAANLLQLRTLQTGQWLQALRDCLSPFSRA